MKQLFICCVIAIAFFSSCKCDDPSNPDCNNYDPFYGKSKPTADFTIRQSMRPLGWEDKPENIAEFCDTIGGGQTGVLFTAKEENAKYQWTIGEDERKFTTKEVALNFAEYLKDSNNYERMIPIKLKIIKVPMSPFDSKDSIYELTRYLVFKPVFLWNGNFEGTFSNEVGKTRKIKIDPYNIINWWVPPGTFGGQPDPVKVDGYGFYGFPQTDTLKVTYRKINDSKTLPCFSSYKQWHWNLSNEDKYADPGIQAVTSGLLSFYAQAEFSKDGKHSIFITYTYRKEFKGKEETFTFKGHRIP
jgi:hypothetical protein